jgi:hypothetical protein
MFLFYTPLFFGGKLLNYFKLRTFLITFLMLTLDFSGEEEKGVGENIKHPSSNFEPRGQKKGYLFD